MHNEEEYICFRGGDHKHFFQGIWSFLILGGGGGVGVRVTPRGHDLLRSQQDLPWHGHGSRNKNIYGLGVGISMILKIFLKYLTTRYSCFLGGGGGRFRVSSHIFTVAKSFLDLYFSVWCQMYIKRFWKMLFNLKDKQNVISNCGNYKVSQQKPCCKKQSRVIIWNYLHKSNTTMNKIK